MEKVKIFIGMITMNISVLAFFSIIISVIILTWWVTGRVIYRRIRAQVIEMERCPYKTPCLKYDEVQTKDAVKRVSKLILQNIETEELQKRKLYEDLASGKLG